MKSLKDLEKFEFTQKKIIFMMYLISLHYHTARIELNRKLFQLYQDI